MKHSTKGLKKGDIVVSNSGYSVVVPVDHILDLLKLWK